MCGDSVQNLYQIWQPIIIVSLEAESEEQFGDAQKCFHFFNFWRIKRRNACNPAWICFHTSVIIAWYFIFKLFGLFLDLWMVQVKPAWQGALHGTCGGAVLLAQILEFMFDFVSGVDFCIYMILKAIWLTSVLLFYLPKKKSFRNRVACCHLQ